MKAPKDSKTDVLKVACDVSVDFSEKFGHCGDTSLRW